MAGSEASNRQEWSLAECACILYRRRPTLAAITGLGILAAAIITLLQPRLYQSTAAIEIQGVNDNFLNLRDIYPMAAATTALDAAYIQTQAEILQNDLLIEQAVQEVLAAQAGSGTRPDRKTVEALTKNIEIFPSRTSRVVRIAAFARDPKLAADLANRLASDFIEQSIETRQRAARETRRLLSGQLDEIRNSLLKSEAALAGYENGWAARPHTALKREVDDNRRFYDAIAQKINEAAVASVVRQSNFRLISPARPGSRPYKPNAPLNLGIGLIGGLLAAIAWVMLREQTNSALRAPGEAGLCLTLPELGAIPTAPQHGSRQWRLLGAGRGAAPETASLERFSTVSESFRATLASILSASHNGGHPRSLAVTSSQPMEGKTTVVGNLGLALAEISNKVLLLDGDMRRPRLHKMFGEANSWGLSDLLREKNAIEDLPLEALVRRTAAPHLYLLPSGACADNIFSLLCSGRMARLMKRFREEFDYVLVDAPPCLEFTDARIMARYVEGVLLVVRANYTEKKTAQAAVQRLVLDGSPVMGVILNHWDPERGDPYGYAVSYGLGGQEVA
jgi:receptor protein-tyrosine kinase